MKMPPVIPRLSFTYITKKTSKLLENLALDPTFVLNNNVAEIKANWLLSQQQPPLQILMEQLKEDFAKSHRSEEHTSELQSRGHLVCRLLLEKKKRSQN